MALFFALSILDFHFCLQAEPVNKGKLAYLPAIQTLENHHMHSHVDGSRHQSMYEHWCRSSHYSSEVTLCLFKCFSDKTLFTKSRGVWPGTFSAIPCAQGGMKDVTSLAFLPCVLVSKIRADEGDTKIGKSSFATWLLLLVAQLAACSKIALCAMSHTDAC